ncbi:hypothetical protein [Stieleria mannarensis]|uniref:hypothetical protein n=1 Tax=Stieleria mannarensis TaxID=2755585 RepID=UPI00160434E3|nr:hypothetical protein [Rhodopirellula sp. JC639]
MEAAFYLGGSLRREATSLKDLNRRGGIGRTGEIRDPIEPAAVFWRNINNAPVIDTKTKPPAEGWGTEKTWNFRRFSLNATTFDSLVPVCGVCFLIF